MKVLIFVTMMLCLTKALFFGITGKPFCFDVDEEPGKTIKFYYEVTGDRPNQTQVHIVSINKKVMVSLTGARNKTEQSLDSTLNICFLSTDGAYKSVSVDFYTHDKAHLLQLAKKSEIYELHSKLVELGESFKQITRKQVFEEERQIIHSQILSNHQSMVKNFGLIKLFVIVAVVMGQLLLLKRMLERRQGYEPV